MFTAAGQGAQGSIIVECAGLRQEIAVQVAFEFDDMRGHWASDYVKQLYAAGIVNGVSATEYGPNSAMRRGDFVLMLYRAAGEPAVSGRAEFSDVPEDAYFADAVAWAAAEGITQGRGDGSFAPLRHVVPPGGLHLPLPRPRRPGRPGGRGRRDAARRLPGRR